MKKFYFSIISDYLKNHSIKFKTSLDNNFLFNSINSLNDSEKDDLTFFHNNKYLKQLKSTKAKACFIQLKHLNYLNKICTPIIVDDPYLTYALVTNLLYPSDKSDGKIHKSAHINNDSNIGTNVQINENVVIKKNCKIDNNVIIYENSVIGPDVEIGNETKIMSGCVISNSLLGQNCLIQPGAIIGGKGFGFTPKQKIEIKHLGNVIIGNNVDIGSNTTIDRGTIKSTVIGDNCRIDNLVQIGHNVQIGNNSIIASLSGISGSTKIGSNCTLGGQVGVAGHLNIGDNVIIAAKSGVTKDINSNCTIGGFPARDIKQWRKSVAKQYKDIK